MTGFRLPPPCYRYRWPQGSHKIMQSTDLIRLLHGMDHLVQSRSCPSNPPIVARASPGLVLVFVELLVHMSEGDLHRKLWGSTVKQGPLVIRSIFILCGMWCIIFTIFNLVKDRGGTTLRVHGFIVAFKHPTTNHFPPTLFSHMRSCGERISYLCRQRL